MIRLVQRKLIIPRGDTGTLTIPLLPGKEVDQYDIAVFTIFNQITHKKIFEKIMDLETDGSQPITTLVYHFTHGDTVNLPVGQYVWDIKFYNNPTTIDTQITPEITDKEIIDGIEVDSYYAAFQLPICEIRETGDLLLMADEAPDTTIKPIYINGLATYTQAAQAAQTAAEGAKDIAVQKAADASGYATAAAQSAEAAAISQTLAETAEDHAQGYAQNAATSATEAASSAATAAAKAAEIEADLSNKADKTDTLLYTTLSRGRKENTTVGSASFAFGQEVTASGARSHAEGYGGIASGDQSHIEGYNSSAIASNAHAEGDTTQAKSNGAHSEGYYTEVTQNSEGGHAEGYYTIASGTAAHAEGAYTHATAEYTHAEGNGTYATQSRAHAEGYNTVASGSASHAEGQGGYATGSQAHAEGYNTSASNSNSHAEGYATQASGYNSHAEGDTTQASGTASHAEGSFTIANSENSHVSGAYNTEISLYPNWVSGASYEVGDRVRYDGTGYICTQANSNIIFSSRYWDILPFNSETIFVVGNGTANNKRSNALTLNWDGSLGIQGDLTVFSDSQNETTLTNALAAKADANYASNEETESIITGWEASA